MTVSILIPVYNVEKYIERCARSLFEQTFSDIEYVFVNDCTPDKSIEVLKEIVNEYPQRKDHVKIIKHEKNRGLAVARNTAVENCQTDFLIHVDSDDYLEIDAIEKLVTKQKEGNYDIVTGNALIHRKKSTKILRKNEPNEKEELIRYYIRPVLNHTIWGRLIRKSLYKDNDIHALEGCNVGEDHQVIPQLFYYTKTFASIDDIIYHYDCMNDNSYMNQNDDNKLLVKHYQNTFSFNELRLFFEDKNPIYLKEVYTYLPIYLKRTLKLCIKTKNKKIYEELQSYNNQLNKSLLKETFFKRKKVYLKNTIAKVYIFFTNILR